MRTLLVTLVALSIAADAIGAKPLLVRRRCRGVARPVGTTASAVEQPGTRSLFNGRDLAGWSVIEMYDFAGHGRIMVEDDAIILEAGRPASGIRVDGDFPRTNYEVTLETKRIEGSDFFCGITFPVGDDYLSLVLGGWGGGTTGISNLDNLSAVENATTRFQEFEQNHWYRIRLRVTDAKVEAWVDDDQIVDVEHARHRLSIWWEQEPVRPFGIASWYTKAALRDIRLTRLEAE